MKALLTGVWAIAVTLGAGYAVSSMEFAPSAGPVEVEPQFEALEYTSLPTLSVPVLHEGGVAGYVVVRIVYTADATVLANVASTPDPFLTDEVFRTLYDRAEIQVGRLQPLNLAELAESVRSRVNERMGDEVVRDLLVHGINYISATDAAAGAPNPTGGPGSRAMHTVPPPPAQPAIMTASLMTASPKTASLRL